FRLFYLGCTPQTSLRILNSYMAPFGATTSDQADLSTDAARLAAVKPVATRLEGWNPQRIW
ncbi:hypothetical protein OAF58_01035, partial [bacterium]|nr:hypothetical protein [bacterium]